jgi:5-methylcytosine-specific restriction endonuclease McrA
MRCFNDYKTSKNYKINLQKYNKGMLSDRNTIKRCLTKLFGYKCFTCGLDHWQGHQLSLELDHVDGNAGNNQPSNLRLVCPNCHSITPTWKGRNKGSGRASRGLKLF